MYDFKECSSRMFNACGRFSAVGSTVAFFENIFFIFLRRKIFNVNNLKPSSTIGLNRQESRTENRTNVTCFGKKWFSDNFQGRKMAGMRGQRLKACLSNNLSEGEREK